VAVEKTGGGMRVIRAALAILALVAVSAVFLWAFVRLSDFYDRARRRAIITIIIVGCLVAAGLTVLIVRYGFPVT
jgi:hypothetical protein